MFVAIGIIAVAVSQIALLVLFRRSEKERHISDVLTGQVFMKQAEFNDEVIKAVKIIGGEEK